MAGELPPFPPMLIVVGENELLRDESCIIFFSYFSH